MSINRIAIQAANIDQAVKDALIGYLNLAEDTAGVGAASGTGVAATETGSGTLHRTRLTLSALAQTITNGAAEYTGTSIYTFPKGRILFLGSVFTLAPTTTTTLSTTITTGTTGSMALGTVTASNASLTSTMVSLAPATSYTSSTTINVAAAAVSSALAAAAQFDGTTTAVAMFLNNSIATNSSDGGMTWTGTIDFTWINLGTY